MSHTCFKCNSVPVAEEYQRCANCEKFHQELAKQLDSRPKVKREKVREQLYPIKKMRQGIECTDWISAEDARNMGIRLEDLQTNA